MTAELTHIRLELDKAASVVATASRLLDQGRAIDLHALEGKVAGACRAIEALPAEDARDLLPTLEALLEALDGLEGDLRHQFAAGAGRQRATPPRAAAAYGRLAPREVEPDDDDAAAARLPYSGTAD